MKDLLFDVPESLSPRLRWKEKHRILTFSIPADVDSRPWTAFQPDEEQELSGSPGDDWVNHRAFHGDNGVAYGQTETEAMQDLAAKLNLPLWNQ